MGAPLGELYDILSNQVTWVHLKWKEYRALFGTSQERIDFLNEAAPAFFGDLQDILLNDVLLHLCRLTDPPKSAGKPNLTIECLPPLISDAALRGRVKELLERAKDKTSFAREWRNRRLAHREFPVTVEVDTRSLTPGSRQDVEEALAAIRAVMNCIEVHYQKSTVLYEHSIEGLGGVDALLKCLEKGVEEKRRRKGRFPLT
ncbi:MAG: hypothetical protein ACREQA_09090 [Candidatus Binatia bacterium]